MLKIILTYGLPASGKSSWAKSIIDKNPNQYKRISKDMLRNMLDNNYWSKDCEKLVLEVRDSIIVSSLKKGKHVIVDDTNLSPKHRERIKQLIRENNINAKIEIKDFTDVPIEECIKRDLKRENSVGKDVILRMYNKFLKPRKKEIVKHEFCPALPYAIIIDMDGTLSFFNDRSPYREDLASSDSVCHQVKKTIELYKNNGFKILILTGRNEKRGKDVLLKWLKNHKIPYDGLWMRPDGDERKDPILKREMYEKNVKGKYNVFFVLDDRPSVRRMWIEELGLYVFSSYQDVHFSEF